MRILLIIEYFGKNYSGWQAQTNALAVQNVLEKTLSDFLNHRVILEASGRTDGGVHALAQSAHFDTTSKIAPHKIALAINSRLSDDIRIKEAFEVPQNFHARYDPKNKTYLYKFYISRVLSPTRNDTYAQLVPPINYEAMSNAVQDLLGTHDFAGFSSTGSHVKNTIRTISDVKLIKNDDEIYFYITGDGFLYNMVRIIAGTLAYIARGQLPPNAIKTVLETKDRKKAGKTYPPQGLYLYSVDYGDKIKKS